MTDDFQMRVENLMVKVAGVLRIAARADAFAVQHRMGGRFAQETAALKRAQDCRAEAAELSLELEQLRVEAEHAAARATAEVLHLENIRRAA